MSGPIGTQPRDVFAGSAEERLGMGLRAQVLPVEKRDVDAVRRGMITQEPREFQQHHHAGRPVVGPGNGLRASGRINLKISQGRVSQWAQSSTRFSAAG